MEWLIETINAKKIVPIHTRALDGFEERGLVSREVLAGLLELTAAGELDGVVNEARGLAPDEPLPEDDRAFLQESARA